jgi:hypothetical protein
VGGVVAVRISPAMIDDTEDTLGPSVDAYFSKVVNVLFRETNADDIVDPTSSFRFAYITVSLIFFLYIFRLEFEYENPVDIFFKVLLKL